MNIEQLRAQIAALQNATMDKNRNFLSGYHEGKFDALSAVDALLDSLQEEPVSEDLEEAVDEYAPDFSNDIASKAAVDAVRDAFKAGAKWQEEKDAEEKVLTYKHGFEDCKKQMMTEAIDADVVVDRIGEVTYLCPHTKATPYKKVKVIVIKED